MKNLDTPNTGYYPAYVISLCAIFLFLKYILQIYPSIITEQLMQEFQLTGAGLGNLVANFYYAYMVTQLIVGYLLDRFSPRWITAAAILGCGLGALFFANSYTVLSASLSRFLMGAGVAFATVAYMKLASIWFPPRRYAFVSGLLATAAMAGAVFGEAPLAWIMHHFGWRPSIEVVGLASIIIAILFALTVKTRPKSVGGYTKIHINMEDIKGVLLNKQNWLLTLYSGLAFSPVAVFGGLWGNPFLQQAFNLSKLQASSMLSLVFIGLGLGSPILGMVSDKLNNRIGVMFYSTFISFIALVLILFNQALSPMVLGFLLFTFGFGLGAFMIVFAIGKELNSLKVTGTIIAMINASDAILDDITEPLIGKLLDYNWDGTIVNQVHYFSLHSYRIGLSVLPLYLLIACALLWWIKPGLLTLEANDIVKD